MLEVYLTDSIFYESWRLYKVEGREVLCFQQTELVSHQQASSGIAFLMI